MAAGGGGGVGVGVGGGGGGVGSVGVHGSVGGGGGGGDGRPPGAGAVGAAAAAAAAPASAGAAIAAARRASVGAGAGGPAGGGGGWAGGAGGAGLVPALQREGVVRVALTADEINGDLAALLATYDAAQRARGAERREAAAAGGDGRAGGGAASRTNDVVVARGVLQLHAETYAQGDHVAVLSPKSGSPKYIGWICSINSKEVQIRDVRDVAHRVYVSHLRNNRLFLRRTCDVL